MKTKRIKIGFKDVCATLDDFVDTGEALARGEQVGEEAGVYFTNIEAFRKAITPRRLALLNIIRPPGLVRSINWHRWPAGTSKTWLKMKNCSPRWDSWKPRRYATVLHHRWIMTRLIYGSRF